MISNNFIAIGRSRYLFDTINYLVNNGLTCIAIITGERNDEYNVSVDDFSELASKIKAQFFNISNLERDEIIELIKSNKVKIAISVNWKFQINESFINLFELGILNLHLGNLPDYKGNATVNWSIVNGENHIYANIHKMVKEIDEGDIIARRKIEINNKTYVGDVLDESLKVAPQLFYKSISKLMENSSYFLEKGNANGLRCFPRLPQDGEIDWNQSADNISKLIRASSKPYPGAFTFFNGKKIIIWKAKVAKWDNPFLAINGHIIRLDKIEKSIYVSCKDGVLKLTDIEIDGERKLPTDIFKSVRLRLGK